MSDLHELRDGSTTPFEGGLDRLGWLGYNGRSPVGHPNQAPFPVVNSYNKLWKAGFWNDSDRVECLNNLIVVSSRCCLF